MNRKRLEYKTVEKYFLDNKCILISKSVKNSKSKIRYICKNGHRAVTNWMLFKGGGYRCSRCAGNAKHTLQYMIKFFKNNGCVLLEKEYKNKHTPMLYICNCGKESKCNYENFKRGVRCKECGYNRVRKPQNIEKAKYARLCRGMVRRCFKLTGKVKMDKTEGILGYSSTDLMEHIKNHPNYKAIDENKMTIDHIFPIMGFLEFGITDIRLINCLENLQPLSMKENISKLHRYNKEQFKQWLKTKGIVIDEKK